MGTTQSKPPGPDLARGIAAADVPDGGMLAGHVGDGRSREEIIQLFVKKWGSQEVLTEPIDRGFNRLAWLLPYGVGLAGIVLVGGIAMRWSRRRTDGVAVEPAPVPTAPAALQDRLDDELRELD